MTDDEVLEQFRARIKAKLDDLAKRKGQCMLCGKETNRWAVVIPKQGKGGSIGFGEPTNPDMTRIAFTPICADHNTDNEVVQKRANAVLSIVAASWRG